MWIFKPAQVKMISPDSSTPVKSMVATGYDAIVVNTITEQNLVPCIIKGSKAGIPMIDPDGRIDIKAVEEGGGKLYQGSTLDYYEQGMLGAQYIVEQLGEQGGKVAIIEGLLGSPQGEARRNGAKDTFEAAENIEIGFRTSWGLGPPQSVGCNHQYPAGQSRSGRNLLCQ